QDLYDQVKHRHLVDILNHDPKTTVGVYAAQATWMLGRPDEAVRVSDEKDAHARRVGHPFDLGWALGFGAGVFNYRCEPDALRERAEKSERLGRENNMPFIWACVAPLQYGAALVRKSDFVEGLAVMTSALAIWEGGGGRVFSPYGKCVLAEARTCLGDLDGPLQLIEEQIVQIERPGWEERCHYAEILRLKGWMLSLKGDLAGAERNYLASLDWAREQQAKSWELRTSTSLARLWQGQGKRREALDLLKPVYGWFTEGFDTKDLKEAKALLDALG
ncbi:MAG: hypothetical protein ACT4PQ_05355, partial [Betaproteobacteria bacterium]